MNYLLCLDCFSVYDAEFLKYPYCPKINCDRNTELIELDELMIEPIKILNQKGYVTEYCCSGHLYENFLSTYIMFNKHYMPTTLPKDWILDEYNNSIIRYRDSQWKDKKVSQRQKSINKAIQSLLEWSENLENCPEQYE